jgi:cyclopropane fatty-acyl-phospholipid synthase-like methyltransferase
VITEREHWLSITDDPDWKRNHISDPNISLDDTVEAVVSAFPYQPQRILEIGCGYGRLTEVIAKAFPDAVVMGVDINPQVLPESWRQVMYVCRDDLIGLSGFDVIYSVAVFQHLPDVEKRAYITQAYQALNRGGVFRLQFIDGDRDNFCDHWVDLDEITTWFDDVGFHVQEMSHLVHPQWCWITGLK